jgi:hypothetical protein
LQRGGIGQPIAHAPIDTGSVPLNHVRAARRIPSPPAGCQGHLSDSDLVILHERAAAAFVVLSTTDQTLNWPAMRGAD